MHAGSSAAMRSAFSAFRWEGLPRLSAGCSGREGSQFSFDGDRAGKKRDGSSERRLRWFHGPVPLRWALGRRGAAREQRQACGERGE
jgi:hypothetical protein